MPTSSIVFSPEISERDLDREVRDVNRQLEGMASDLPVGLDAQMDATRPAGAGGLNQTSGLLAFAEERNDTLVEIRELLDEDYVGSTGDSGRDIGGSVLGSSISRFLLGGGVGAPAGGIGTTGAAGGLAGIGMLGLAGIHQWWMGKLTPQQRRSQVDADKAARPLDSMQSTSDSEGIFGAMDDFQWPDEPAWMGPFTHWQWPQTPGWMDPFARWRWPDTPGWMDPFARWRWPDTPGWMDPFTNWSFPKTPQWMADFLGIFGGGGSRQSLGTSSYTTPSGETVEFDQPLYNANRRQGNRANNRMDVTSNFDTQINLDPRRVAQELTREVEGMVDDAVSDLERELRNSRPETATPGRR